VHSAEKLISESVRTGLGVDSSIRDGCPLTATGRLKQGIDDRHICRGISQGPGSNRPVLDRERKSIRLKRVLIDRIECAVSAVKISYAGSIANIDMAAARLWMSKRKLNADSPAVTENMDVLVGGGFCRQRQCGVAGREVENRAREAMAVTTLCWHDCIAGMTRVRAISAAPRMPQRTGFITRFFLSEAPRTRHC